MNSMFEWEEGYLMKACQEKQKQKLDIFELTCNFLFIIMYGQYNDFCTRTTSFFYQGAEKNTQENQH